METGMKLINRDKAIMAFRECLWSKPEVHPSLNLDDVEIILYGMPTENIYTEQNVRDAFTEGYGAGKYDCTHWIPCCERMPEETNRYLVTNNRIGAWLVDIDVFDIELQKWYYDQNVVAWMPLPKPYEGEKK